MKPFTIAVLCALSLPLSLHAQGQIVWRPVDLTKPRDGFGFVYEMKHTVTNGGTVSNSYPIIFGVADSTPAKAAGLQPGDEILSADGKDLMRDPIPLNPPAGTMMVLRVRHKDLIREVRLVSARLYTPPISVPADTTRR